MAEKLPEWAADLARNLGTAELKAIVEDLRGYNASPAMGKAAKVTVQGAGTVTTGTDGAKHTPASHGWTEAPPLPQDPPGWRGVDALLDADDRQWREQRKRDFELARLRGEVERKELSELEAKLNPATKGPQK
jgi:hypothetical protein